MGSRLAVQSVTSYIFWPGVLLRPSNSLSYLLAHHAMSKRIVLREPWTLETQTARAKFLRCGGKLNVPGEP
jgi:hypothetical protein